MCHRGTWSLRATRVSWRAEAMCLRLGDSPISWWIAQEPHQSLLGIWIRNLGAGSTSTHYIIIGNNAREYRFSSILSRVLHVVGVLAAAAWHNSCQLANNLISKKKKKKTLKIIIYPGWLPKMKSVIFARCLSNWKIDYPGGGAGKEHVLGPLRSFSVIPSTQAVCK